MTRFVLILVSIPLLARQKTDVIVMTNGDRITCEIKQLNSGVLFASLDYVDGTISVNWSKVARLQSSQLFNVETAGGLSYSGTLKTVEGPEDQPRKIEIVPDPPGRDTVVEQSEVVLANQYGDSVWRRLHGTFTSGFSYNKSNNTTQLNLGSNLTYLPERAKLELDYSSVLSSTSGTPQTTRNQVNFNAQRLLRWNNWYYAGTAGLLQSSAQGIKSQTIFGGGVGRYFWNTNSGRLGLTGGLALQNTHYTDRPTQHDVVGLIAGELYAFKFKKSNLVVTPVLLPSITDRGRIRFNLNTQYKIEIISNFWFNTTIYGNWDNRPPEGFVGSDYGTTVGITYSFH